MLTKIHYLFFLIVGQPDVVQMLYGRVSDDTINLINYQLTLLISYKLLSSY